MARCMFRRMPEANVDNQLYVRQHGEMVPLIVRIIPWLCDSWLVLPSMEEATPRTYFPACDGVDETLHLMLWHC